MGGTENQRKYLQLNAQGIATCIFFFAFVLALVVAFTRAGNNRSSVETEGGIYVAIA